LQSSGEITENCSRAVILSHRGLNRAILKPKELHDQLTRKCSRENCGNRFTLTIRAGRNSDKAMAGRKRTYHQASVTAPPPAVMQGSW